MAPIPSLLSTAAARARVGDRRAITKTSAVGWRVWRYRLGAEIRLASPEAGDVWEPGRRFRSACHVTKPGTIYHSPLCGPHVVPDPDCTCGVYVSDSIAGARASFVGGRDAPWFVAGRVRLHGRIIGGRAEGEWRGESASIVALYVSQILGASALAEMLADGYRVPVEVVRDLDGLGPGVPLDVAADVRRALGWDTRRAGTLDSRPLIEQPTAWLRRPA